MAYRIEKREQSDGQLTLLLHAGSGPAGTRDYRIEANALRVREGTLLHIRSSYRTSMTSALLTRTYLSTLGRDKIGFTRIEQEGVVRPVQGMRGVIERNVMRYQIAIDSFLGTQSLPELSRREAALKNWFRQNDSYPQQLHEMSEKEYLEIKQREWDNQHSQILVPETLSSHAAFTERIDELRRLERRHPAARVPDDRDALDVEQVDGERDRA